MYPRVGLKNQTILLNGIGNITRFSGHPAPAFIKEPYTLLFKSKEADRKPKKYLLRLINTSFDTTFVFSIDNHNLTIVTSDFVPIHPYSNTSVLVGIGQRYNVIVEANPIFNASQPIPDDLNFWMRTYVSECTGGTAGYPEGYEASGVLRYNSESTAFPRSLPWNDVSKDCSDETYASLVPVYQWQIGNPANAGQEHDVSPRRVVKLEIQVAVVERLVLSLLKDSEVVSVEVYLNSCGLANDSGWAMGT